MWWTKASWRLVLAIALAALWSGPAIALVDCKVPLHDGSFAPDPETLHVVPDSLLPAAFNSVFTLMVNWDWEGEDPWWPQGKVIALADLIMPDLSGPIGPDDSYAHRTAQF